MERSSLPHGAMPFSSAVLAPWCRGLSRWTSADDDAQPPAHAQLPFAMARGGHWHPGTHPPARLGAAPEDGTRPAGVVMDGQRLKCRLFNVQIGERDVE